MNNNRPKDTSSKILPPEKPCKKKMKKYKVRWSTQSPIEPRTSDDVRKFQQEAHSDSELSDSKLDKLPTKYIKQGGD